MKVRLGGTVEFNVIPVQYESVKATSTFEVEEELEDYSEEKMKELDEKVKAQLQKTLNKHIDVSLREFSSARKKARKYLED